jgi:DNA-binding NarL/FixJ family response regulator
MSRDEDGVDETAIPGTSIRVLVVDDHQMFAESLARLLSEEPDIDVVGSAHDGERAVSLARALMPDVVLIDFQLPDRDGAQVAADIKLHAPDAMIVMLTGASDDRVLLAAIDAGCSGFLTKDNAARDVVEAVRGAAAGEALISPTLLARLLPKLQRSYRPVGADLTDREREVLHGLAAGKSNKAIAADLHLSVNTIRNYVQSLLMKLGAHSKLEAVSTAVRQGIIDYS